MDSTFKREIEKHNYIGEYTNIKLKYSRSMLFQHPNIIMNQFPSDIIFFICSYYEKNKDIIYLLSTSVYLHTLKYKYIFNKEPAYYYNITLISYKENIKNVIVENVSELMDCKHITHLTFGDDFYQHLIKPGILPSSLTHLTFGNFFNKPIESGILPSLLTHLTFGYYFNQPITSGVLPSSLIHLTFGDWFDQPIEPDVLPSSITHLKFGVHFNKPITPGVLPCSLTHLTFGSHFGGRIEPSVLPSLLTHLTFGWLYKQPIEPSVLPSSLTRIYLNIGYPSEYREKLPPRLFIRP
jgi:hypothetical protein